MTSTDAQELMTKLLHAAAEDDFEFINSHNLTPATVLLIRKVTEASREVEQLEQILQRREEQERELEHLLLVELQRLP
jgi:hypothetical protein